MKYIHRVIEKTVKKNLKVFPVVGITGPRQSGKSTMLINTLDYEYITFDDVSNINLFNEDPDEFISSLPSKVVLDEVQKVPGIFSYIKRVVDKKAQKAGQFVLTGSSQFSFLKRISESLAGRISLLTLLPFQYSEIPDNLKYTSIYKGGYPRLVKNNYKLSNNWYSSYLTTYLERDLRTLLNIGDINDFYRLIKILSNYCSKIINLSEISGISGIPVSTLKRWLSVLEASYIIFFLRPYYKNRTKRFIKSSKIYFYDTGLVSYLSGISTKNIFEQGPMHGSIFENYIISEIMKNDFHNSIHSGYYFYRTSSGNEIDLIIEKPRKEIFIEIKSSFTLKPIFLKHLKSEKLKGARGILLYNGKSMKYGDNIEILNYKDYFEK